MDCGEIYDFPDFATKILPLNNLLIKFSGSRQFNKKNHKNFNIL